MSTGVFKTLRARRTPRRDRFVHPGSSAVSVPVNPAPLPGIKQFDLSGRTALITGGSKGLGEAIAAGLASAGADVALVSRHLDQADAAALRIAQEFGRRAFAFCADITSPEQVEATAQAAVR